jgi:sugar/nucleoside kinase (ribokinase family)
MEIAKENGVINVFDLDVCPSYMVEDAGLATNEEMKRALELADVLIPCKTAARELIGSDDIIGNATKLLQYGAKTVAVTLGKQGCIVLDKDSVHRVPTYHVKVVDTTGAGDAFHGGFIYSVLNKFDLVKSARFANACGALGCTEVGARASKDLRQVEDLMQNGDLVE